MVLFNSRFNLESFLGSIDTFFKAMPDCRPKGLSERLRTKCKVLYFPVSFPNDYKLPKVLSAVVQANTTSGIWANIEAATSTPDNVEGIGISSDQPLSVSENVLDSGVNCKVLQNSQPLHIVWPHRWYTFSYLSLLTCFTSVSRRLLFVTFLESNAFSQGTRQRSRVIFRDDLPTKRLRA